MFVADLEAYERAESDFFRSLDETQWRVLDNWIQGEPVSLVALAATLSYEQLPLMAAWTQSLARVFNGSR